MISFHKDSSDKKCFNSVESNMPQGIQEYDKILPLEYIKKYFKKQLREIEDSLESLDEREFKKLVDEAVEALNLGHKIVVSGLGKNVPICEKFVGSMLSLGMDACFLHTNSAVHGDMGAVKEGDLVIILTKSGETQESIYLVQRLKERNANLWLLTFEQESTLTKEISKCIVLKLRHEGDMWNIMPNNSTTVNLVVLQGLAMMIAREQRLGIEDFKRNHPGGKIGKILNS